MQNRRFNRFGTRPAFRKSSFPKRKSGFSAKKIDVSRFVQKSTLDEEEIAYRPIHHFADFKIEARLKNNINRKGYEDPTPIQDKIIPLVLEGKDVVGMANTGTGKTAAFLIPLINKSLLSRENKTIIIVPTRELALQIEKEFREFAAGLNLYSVVCIGGTSVGLQFRSLKKNNDFVIGTPGRIKDMVQRKALNMARFKTVVLDEADRMLDMGFIADVKYLMEQMPAQKQILLFSATIPNEIEALAGKFLKEPVKISVKTREASANVNQDIVRAGEGGKKLETLCEMLGRKDFNKTLIFGRTRHGVEKLSKDLARKGFRAESIHGDKTQIKRKKAIDFFKGGQGRILVATDVAARGLDIDNISHVINYDLPATYDDYVHRIGRTGRGRKKGEAITFV
ncbi:MAG: DEAD/DEAH box helicase [Candidatus Paceibacterota bacterium]|jgi:superfamily II DNA/RNA helicase|nr:DEAD/DEAH box helicase [Candidatus Paceibacterota bacterium]MDD5555123.1 DEAD/DEAH box helicase [Candidatus Paceibacterota bacterium]